MDFDVLFRGSAFALGMGGLLLLLWFLLADQARGRKRCPKCWYDMSSADSLRCPECGHDARRDADLLRTRRRWKGAWLCTLVFLAAALLWIQPDVRQNGWASVLPSTALILCLRLEDNQAFFAELDRRTQTDAAGFPVTDPESLYQWQWRDVGNTCLDRTKDDPDVSERRLLFEWLFRASSSVGGADADRFFREMVRFLEDDDPGIRRKAALFCADARSPEYAIESIRPLLDDPVLQVRVAAVSGLRLLGRGSRAPVPVLVEALRHEDAAVRAAAAHAIGSIAFFNEEPTVAIEALVDLYRSDPDVQVRAAALGAICRFESQRQRAHEFMREAFFSAEPVMREEAISALTMMEPFDDAFDLEFALRGLDDESPAVRRDAAFLLGSRISTDSLKPHEERLRGFAASDDEDVRDAAWHHLRRIRDSIED